MISSFLDYWLEHYPNLPPEQIGFTLNTLILSNEYNENKNGDINLLWTGPQTDQFTIRRIDQTLLDIIRSSSNEVFLVSFAVYRIPSLITEIDSAIERGVGVSFLLETPETSQRTISYDPRSSFSTKIADHADFYIWPHQNRPVSSRGNKGVLHAKIAVGDQEQLLISSANLTQHAMQINMEMGVHIMNGDLPKKVVTHFQELVRKAEVIQLK
jgi:phosphatidylserine/phosphatidylglycerophosphate/cardiolipin synthase-like enzyme